ncbi:MAG: hypothetical protein ACI8PP_001894, partial [Candidatus Pseudothioglobus sp.]
QIARNNDLVGIHISDSLERELPRPDVYTITNGSERTKIDTTSKRFREDYQNHFDTHMNTLRREFTRNKSPLFELQTHEPVIETLVQKYNAYARQI